MVEYKKIWFLFSASQKKQFFVLTILILFGVFFEMLGLGILIPSLGLLLNPDLRNVNPLIKSVIDFFGNPSQSRLILIGLSFILIVYFIKSAYLIFLSWKQSKFTTNLSATISDKLFSGYMRMPMLFHVQRNSSQLVRNIQGEVAQFNAVVQALSLLSIELCVIIGLTIVLVIIEPFGGSMVLSLLFAATLLFHYATKNKILKWGINRQSVDGKINKELFQGLNGIREIKVMGREDFFLKEFQVNNQERASITSKQLTLNITPRFFLEFLAVLGLVALVIVMRFQGKTMEAILPVVGAFIAAAFRIIPSANRIIASIQQFRYGRPVVNLFYDEFKMLKEYKIDEVQEKENIKFQGMLEIKNLSFEYNTEQRKTKVLNDISFRINKGELIGIVGPSGSGKSTLIDIILGLIKPTSGTLFVDGKDYRVNIREWQNLIGYVPQTIYLIDDTLKKNIAFGVAETCINEEAIFQSLKSAQLDEFVKTLLDGLETLVGERGVLISGGQRQRIAIARALYNDPEILILDEATSALDETTEAGVMDAVNALHRKKTVIMVTHKPSILSKCDKIYYLENGYLNEQFSVMNNKSLDHA
jgi:ABC-type multidrug transport system fused ATPase/permease subunit